MRAARVLAATLIVVTACGDDGSPTNAAAVIDVRDAATPELDPADVVDAIDNPYLPLTPGSRWVYEGVVDGERERVEVVVTDERRAVMGIDAVVVRDVVMVDGEVVEDTFDWFAQDVDGNVWYLGEDSREIEDGEVVSTEGSWEAGVDGARPGIVMPAEPTVGRAYRQELYPGEAEDLAEVVEVGDRLVIREWNPLEPEVVEEKTYERGVGLVLETVVRGGEGQLELVEHVTG